MNEIDMSECECGIFPASSCARCKAQLMPTVYVSGGGMKYHRTMDCPALIEGQSMVETPSPVKPVSLGSEIAQERDPCKTCHPLVA